MTEGNEETKIDVERNIKLCQDDLALLKKQIQKKQESINNLKTTLLYKKKVKKSITSYVYNPLQLLNS